MDDLAGDGGLPEVELCDRLGDPKEGIDMEVLSRLVDIGAVFSSLCGRLGVLALLFADSLLPDDPGRLGEPSTSAKSLMDVFGRTGEAVGNADFEGACSIGAGFAGDVNRALGTGGLRTDPNPCVEERRDILNGETGCSGAATGRGSFVGLAAVVGALLSCSSVSTGTEGALLRRARGDSFGGS